MAPPVVEIAPFRAWEYDTGRVSLAQVTSPPFDVVTEADLARLRKSSPYNIVHLTLPPTRRGTKRPSNPYAVSQALWEAWTQAGIVRPTAQETLYAYECAYTHRGRAFRLRGVLARLRLDPEYRSVLPHEETFPKPTEQRVQLLRATAADLEPIQLLYSGPSAEETLWAYLDGAKRPADLAVAGTDGAVHRYWRITDAAVIATVAEAFKGRKAYIADGHHRYAAAVAYAAERREREYRPPRKASWDYKLSLLVNTSDPGLQILPTHRVVKRAKVTKRDALVERWSEHFRVAPVTLDDRQPLGSLAVHLEQGSARGIVGAWLGEAHTGYRLEARHPALPETLLPGRSLTYRSLDVVHLQVAALGHGMGVAESKWGDDIHYTRDEEEATQWVRKKRAVAVLLHRPTPLAHVRAIADSGERMPQKSTYFIPKTISGVVLYSIGKAPAEPVRPRVTS